ncbi:MAG: hypothetical protein REH79_03475 [Spiroplasma sp.]|nr:hypothetical protein [Spiroplasma sp.]
MKKIINWFKNYKKPWKLLIINLLVIIAGASIIINIAYLPKYFGLKIHNETSVNINVTAKDDKNKNLFTLQYQSSMKTLGDLMALHSTVYDLQMTGFGRFLLGITYINIEGKKDYLGGDPNTAYWAIKKNNEMAMVGIDQLYLHTNDTFELVYTKL